MSGKCYYCNKTLDKRGIKRHLNACKERKQRVEGVLEKSENIKNYYVIEISDKYRKSDFWMYVACSEDCTLEDLDKFLRNVWLECCGHLSQFEIDGIHYNSPYDYEDTFDNYFHEVGPIDIKLKEVLRNDIKFNYIYDFGTSTELSLKVVDIFKYETKNNKIEIMARHDNVEYVCMECYNDAIFISPNRGPVCENCAGEEAEWLIEIGECSSPRCGECGYMGSREDEQDYLPQ